MVSDSEYMKMRRQHIQDGRPLPKKKKYFIKPKSDKRIAKEKEQREAEGEISLKEVWFQARRVEMTGICGCGCGQPSSKYDNKNFRNSACHIFPYSKFKSVQYHPLNFVERNWEDGCHHNMDNTSMDRWPNFADWENIKRRVRVLSQLLTPKERAKKFFSHIDKLVNGHG